MSSTRPSEARGRRAMQRSRFGCRNCKLRKLKCDENKPQCRRCSSFGVLCNYNSTPNIPDLHPVADDSLRSLVVRERRALARVPSPLSGAFRISNVSISTSYGLDAKCRDFVTRYLGRSLISPNNTDMIRVNRQFFNLAFTHPFLMHASIAVALAYDRHLNAPSSCRRTSEECYHWYQSTVLFNQKLRKPIETKDKDAIWGTAAALAILSFSSPDGCTPETSWPLKSSSGPSSSYSLEWLRISQGKMSLWCTANPLRPDSLFRAMAGTFAQMHSPFPGKGVDGIPEALAIACRLGDSSTAENNPYFDAAHAVARIQRLPDSQVTTGQIQLFLRGIRGSFECLLRGKDPVALLLLYLWYRKVGRCMWWIELRARMECPSICSYLRLHHRGCDAVQAFLPGGPFADTWSQ